MRTRRISTWVFFTLAISLHLAFMASAYFWYTSSPVIQSPQPLVVSVIVPAAPVSAAPPSPPRPPAPQAPPKPAKAPSRQPPKPKPAPRQVAPAPRIAAPLPQPSPDAMKAPAPEPQAAAEPVPPASSPTVTQAPVKTSVSVNASYVAGQTEKWYPSLSKRYGEEGTVVVRVHVSSDGYAERVELKKRSDYPLLDEAAIGLAKSLKYNPAKVDGKAVADWVDIPITFRLRNR